MKHLSLKNILIGIILSMAVLSIASFSLRGTSPRQSQGIPHYVNIKYRTDRVDVNNGSFQHFNTTRSSLVEDAWYDPGNNYMIIDLNGTNYHYCGMPVQVWNNFKEASSLGTYYNASIKGNYDCRINRVPSY